MTDTKKTRKHRNLVPKVLDVVDQIPARSGGGVVDNRWDEVIKAAQGNPGKAVVVFKDLDAQANTEVKALKNAGCKITNRKGENGKYTTYVTYSPGVDAAPAAADAPEPALTDEDKAWMNADG